MRRAFALLGAAASLFSVFVSSTLYFSGRELCREGEGAVSRSLRARLVSIAVREKELAAVGAQSEKGQVTLIFVGDVMLARGVEAAMRRAGDWQYPFLNVARDLSAADILFGNLESPISERGRNQGSAHSFRADPKAAEGLAFAGFDVMSLANNHILDWGPDALSDTVDALHARGIRPIGAGKNFNEANAPAIFEIKKTKIAFLAFTTLYPRSFEARAGSPGVSSFDLGRARADIRELKRSGRADLVVVSFHWGEEYEERASAAQREIVHELAASGADLIVGHHPHVIQELETYSVEREPAADARGIWIAYSLGNFVFDQNFSEATSRGLALRVSVEKRSIVSIVPILVRFSKGFQPWY